MVTLLRSLLILVPLTELVVFFIVVDQIGLLDAIALQILSMVLGLIAVRVLGTASMAEVLEASARDEPPGPALFRGACVLAGGTLMIVPGFLTDALGLCLLIPGLRDFLGRVIWRTAQVRQPRRRGQRPGPGLVIDGEFSEIPAEQVPSPSASSAPDPKA